jgi:hypothetical protein
MARKVLGNGILKDDYHCPLVALLVVFYADLESTKIDDWPAIPGLVITLDIQSEGTQSSWKSINALCRH